MKDLEEAIKMANENGWSLTPSECTLNEYGNLVTTVGEPTDCTGYTMEIDPETGASRHCGNGSGCFWTDWEGDDQEEYELEQYKQERADVFHQLTLKRISFEGCENEIQVDNRFRSLLI